ncbi:hypothetical protein FHR66_003451 [Xanthomonas sp. F4]|nr:hypothetical protein [Xanthomonas sp. 3498]
MAEAKDRKIISLHPNKEIDMAENRWHRGSTIETGGGTGPLMPGQPADAQATV